MSEQIKLEINGNEAKTLAHIVKKEIAGLQLIKTNKITHEEIENLKLLQEKLNNYVSQCDTFLVFSTPERNLFTIEESLCKEFYKFLALSYSFEFGSLVIKMQETEDYKLTDAEKKTLSNVPSVLKNMIINNTVTSNRSEINQLRDILETKLFNMKNVSKYYSEQRLDDYEKILNLLYNATKKGETIKIRKKYIKSVDNITNK